MSFLTAQLKQTITLWSLNGVDSAGDPEYAAPVQILGRWEFRVGLTLDARGEHQRSGTAETSTAFVYLAQDVNPDDYLYLGTSVASDPRTVLNAFRVKGFQKTPGWNATLFERRAFV
jgi:hypothetical protein